MRLTLELPDSSTGGGVSIAGRSRRACATSVVFLDASTLLCASLLDKSLHSVSIQEDRLSLLRSAPTRRPIDLMDYRDDGDGGAGQGRLVAANCPGGKPLGSVSVFACSDRAVHHERTIDLPGHRTHGCVLLSYQHALVLNTVPSACVQLDLVTGTTRPAGLRTAYAPKSGVLLRDEQLLLLVSSRSRPGLPMSIPQDSAIELFDRSVRPHRLLDSRRFAGICDDVAFADGHGLVTVQSRDELLYFTVHDRRIQLQRSIGGFSFPHGVTMRAGRVAVASYGDNTVRVFDIDTLLRGEPCA